MKHIQGTPRSQLVLFQDNLEDMIPEDHIIRFLDLYIEQLDMSALGISENQDKKGLGYNPKLYLKIYIYSYLNNIRSSRKIERECKRNLELIWLTKQLSPDHWSISNFRKCNKQGLMNIFKEFLKFCHKLKLLSFDCIAIDGTKMRSGNSKSNVYARDEIGRVLENIDRKINEYIKELESNDKKEKDEYEFLKKNIPEKLKSIQKHKDKVEFIKDIFNANPDIEKYFATDPESNFQKDNGRSIVGYNCQSAVDEKNKLIVSTDVTRENNDCHQFNNMREKINKAKAALEIDKKTICVADAGYHSELEIIEAVQDEKSDVYIPHPKDVKTKEKKGREKKDKVPAKGFEKDNFVYDKENNFFICPEGEILKQIGVDRKQKGATKIKYQCKKCKYCEVSALCTTNKIGRTVELSENFETMNKFREKVTSDIGKKIINKRKEVVEHPFGTIKRNFGYTYFMQRGLEKVKAEFNFIAFIYNFKRVINIVGVKKLIEVLN